MWELILIIWWWSLVYNGVITSNQTVLVNQIGVCMDKIVTLVLDSSSKNDLAYTYPLSTGLKSSTHDDIETFLSKNTTIWQIEGIMYVIQWEREETCSCAFLNNRIFGRSAGKKIDKLSDARKLYIFIKVRTGM